jgi:predicted phosphodiesterase
MVVSLVAHDLHLPFIDKGMSKKFFATVRQMKPSRIILAGDIIDLHALTTHRRAADWMDRLDIELLQSRQWLEKLRSLAPRCEITYIKGNHEDRLNRMLESRIPEMRSVGISISSLLDLPSLGIHWVEDAGKTKVWAYTSRERFRVLHGHEFKGGGKFPAAHALKIAEALGCNVHIGHTHKLGMFIIPIAGKLRTVVEGGLMANMRAAALGYAGPAPKWANAFTIYDDKEPLPQFVQP